MEATAGFPSPARPGAPKWIAKPNREEPAEERREEDDTDAETI